MNFKRQSKDYDEWLERLPIPYSLKEVEETDRRYESLKANHEDKY